MRLNNYLRADLVLTQLDAFDLESALGVLADHLARHGIGDSRESVEEGLRTREEAHTTVMGRGVALPHATLGGLEEPVLMVAVSRDPIQFGPEETEPVRVFFVLVSPPGREREHIKLLARICRLIRHPGVVESLQEADDSDEVLRTIRQIDEQHV